MLTHSTRVIALSPRWRAVIERIAPRARVEVLCNPVAPPAATLASEPVPGRIAFLGQLARHKGVLELLQAFAIAAGPQARAQLVLAGEGDRALVLECIARLGLGPERVQLAGWIEGAEKDRLLASASIFVLPSFIEGLPVCVLEAMSHGVPVVVSDVGGLPDIVSDGVEGLVVPPGDVPALAQALRRLLDDPREARAMGERGRARARREFDAPIVCRRLEATYAQLIGRGAPCSTA
jgi:glycosyltransferase involved in cell wall biosynthesis